jgi:hypothetical protein
MKKLLALGLAVPALLLASAGIASAAPAGDGANVTVYVNGVQTHRVCDSQAFDIVAQGFAPNRHDVLLRVQSPFGTFYDQISLSGGTGDQLVGPLGPSWDGKYRLKYATGSSGKKVDDGEYTFQIVPCV